MSPEIVSIDASDKLTALAMDEAEVEVSTYICEYMGQEIPYKSNQEA